MTTAAFHRITVTLTHGNPVELNFRGPDSARQMYEELTHRGPVGEIGYLHVTDQFGTHLHAAESSVVSVKLQDLKEVMKADAEAHILALRAQAEMQKTVASDLTIRSASALANGGLVGRN